MRRPCWIRYTRAARAGQAGTRPGGGRRAGGQRGRAGGGQLPADAVAGVVVRLRDQRGVGQVRAVQRHYRRGEEAAIARLRAASTISLTLAARVPGQSLLLLEYYCSGSERDSDLRIPAAPAGARALPAGLLSKASSYGVSCHLTGLIWKATQLGSHQRIAAASACSFTTHTRMPQVCNAAVGPGARQALKTRRAPHVRLRHGART